jgi:hypothetical protein
MTTGATGAPTGSPTPRLFTCTSRRSPDGPDMDPIVSRSLLALAVGLALILAGIALTPHA